MNLLSRSHLGSSTWRVSRPWTGLPVPVPTRVWRTHTRGFFGPIILRGHGGPGGRTHQGDHAHDGETLVVFLFFGPGRGEGWWERPGTP